MGWGRYYLSTVLDDYSRYILAWALTTTMQATDVTATLDLARAHAGWIACASSIGRGCSRADPQPSTEKTWRRGAGTGAGWRSMCSEIEGNPVKG
jgi:transposase InsO family protein